MKTIRIWLIILIIIIGWIYYLFISPRIFNNSILIVPNIINMPEDQAIAKLKEDHIDFNILYEENINNNNVLKTIPYPNTTIKKNYKIDVYIGKIIPTSYISYLHQVWIDVKDDIELFCNNNGIKLKVIYEEVMDNLDGIIIYESIGNKETIEGIKELIITVSSNNTKLKMPNFVGKHINDVLEFIDINKLEVVFIYLETMMIEDIVVYQSIMENTIIDKNNNYKIEIYVSKLMN